MHCPLFATIRNIHIELPASNKQIGREQALDQARDVALKQYIDSHPAQKSQLAALLGDPIQLAKIIKTAHVVKEKFERQRYVCFIDVVFNQENITRYIQTKSKPSHKNLSHILGVGQEPAGISGVGSSQSMLIIPILISEDESLLWEDANKWRLSWQNQEALPAHKGKFTVPLADLRDQITCSIEDAMVERKSSLKSLGERYHQSRITVSILKQLGESDNYELVVKTFSQSGQIKIYEPYHMDNVRKLSHEARFRHAQRLTLEIVAKGVVPDNVQPDAGLSNVQDPVILEDNVATAVLPTPVEKTIAKKHDALTSKDEKLSADKVVPLAVRKTSVDFKEVDDLQSIVPASPIKEGNIPGAKTKALPPSTTEMSSAEAMGTVLASQSLNYTIKFSSLGQLNTMRNTLKKIPQVENFRVTHLNLNQAHVTFDYAKADSDITSLLAQHGIKVTTQNGQKVLELAYVRTPAAEVVPAFDNAALGY